MEPASEIIQRNVTRLLAGPVALVNPARDALAGELRRAGHTVRVTTQDFGDFRWLESGGAVFEAVPAICRSDRTVILNLPREKDRLDMLLHAIAGRLEPTASLWLSGENRGGIKSSARHLHPHFGRVATLDNARHCRLLEATEPSPVRPFDLDDYAVSWSVAYSGRDLRLISLPGVFAHGRLDPGTRLLLAVLERLNPAGRILDFACGAGVVGLALLSAARHAAVTLVDSSALALASCQRSLAANGLNAQVVPSDGLAELTGRFDWLVSNPPFHRGVHATLDVAEGFFREAGTFLAENGKIVVVFNRHLPYLQWLRSLYRHTERLAENGDFVVALAREPHHHGDGISE